MPPNCTLAMRMPRRSNSSSTLPGIARHMSYSPECEVAITIMHEPEARCGAIVTDPDDAGMQVRNRTQPDLWRFAASLRRPQPGQEILSQNNRRRSRNREVRVSL